MCSEGLTASPLRRPPGPSLSKHGAWVPAPAAALPDPLSGVARAEPRPHKVMLTCAIIPRGEPPFVLGHIGCLSLAPQATYSFIRADSTLLEPVAQVHDYSRWSEPAFGLLARLLRRLPFDERAWRYMPRFTCELRVASTSCSFRVEHLIVDVSSDRLNVELRDVAGGHRASALAALDYADLVDVLLHAARIAVWGVDEQAPLPAALTLIPLRRTNEGAAYVLEADIPPYPRKHFQLHWREAQNEQLPAGARSAEEWLRFIGT